MTHSHTCACIYMHICKHACAYRPRVCVHAPANHIYHSFFTYSYICVYVCKNTLMIVQACVCMEMCTCIACVQANAYIHTHMHTCIHTHVHTYIPTYLHTCIHIHIHYIHTYERTYVRTYIHTYIHIHTHTCIHTYVCTTYVHTYTRTYVHTYIHTCTDLKIYLEQRAVLPQEAYWNVAD